VRQYFITVSLLIATSLPLFGQWTLGKRNFTPMGVTPTASTPTFSPIAGTYSSTQTVTISTTTGSVICYNTTGSPATNGTTGCTTGTLYTGTVSVAATETLYAVAGGTGYIDSSVGSASYTISAGGCTGLPSYNLQLLGSTPSAGTISTWADSSGNSDTVTMYGNPVAGTSITPPNGTQTVVFNGVSQYGSLLNSINTDLAVSVCAVYKITDTSNKQFMTGYSNSGGGAAYYPTGGSGSPQGLDKNNAANIGNGTANATTSWTDTCVTYTVGGSYTFYKNGTVDGSGTNGNNFYTSPINTVFSAASPPAVSFYGAVAELDIMNIAISPTQAAAIHSCAVSTYGVP
jgi:hypothetical protein